MEQRYDVELGELTGHEAEVRLVAAGKPTWTATTRQRFQTPIAPSVRHRDAFDRPLREKEALILQDVEDAETFLDPADGRLRCLSVQSARGDRDDAKPYDDSNQPWEVHDIDRPQTPALIKLVHHYSQNRWRSGLLYLPAAIVMTAYLFILSPIDLELENQGRYQPVLYRNWKRSAFAKNARENIVLTPDAPNDQQSIPQADDRLIRRRPMPRFLCFIDDIDLDCLGPSDEVAREVCEDEYEEYVFVSYTRAQFSTAGSGLAAHQSRKRLLEIGIKAAQDAGVRAFWVDCFPLAEGYEDKEEVYRFCDIVRAAHSVAVAIDSSHYAGNNPQKEVEALRDWGSRLWVLPELLLSTLLHPIKIHDCDGTTRFYSKRRLASIAWTVPIMDWTAEEHWHHTSQLLDHYDGSVQLNQLELIDTVHASLRRKYFGKHTNGDIAYCLMGLLRRRPKIVKTDSDFYAFARLSLSNNSDSILERLLCMQPPSLHSEWWRMVDAYGAKLYDIEPLCQIAAVGDWSPAPNSSQQPVNAGSNIVVLDGVYGASICWSKLEPVPFLKRPTRIRRLARTLLPKAPFLFLISVLVMAYIASIMGMTKSNNAKTQQLLNGNFGVSSMTSNLVQRRTAQNEIVTTINGDPFTIPLTFDSTPIQTNTPNTNGQSSPPTPTSTLTPFSTTPTLPSNFRSKISSVQTTTTALISILLTLSVLSTAIFLLTLLAGPSLLLNLYTGKLWSTQARFYGLRGQLPLSTLELHLFGVDEGRLKWSCAGSLLSRQRDVGMGEVVGDDPNRLGELSARDEEGRYLFMLVDTYVMEVNLFYAVRPPTTVMVCGREGGMVRGVLCSYEWRAQAFCREGVLRMKSIVLNRMDRVDRFRFCLSRT